MAFVVGGNWDTPDILAGFKEIGGVLAGKLNAHPMKVLLVDPNLKTLKEIPVS